MLTSARCIVCTSRNRASPESVHRTRRPSSSNKARRARVRRRCCIRRSGSRRALAWPLGATSGSGSGSRGADDVLDHRVSRDPISQVFRAVKSGAVDRHDRRTPQRSRAALQTASTSSPISAGRSVVDEDSGRAMVVDRLPDRVEEAFFASAHDHVLLGQVGRHADAVQLRAGRACASVVPRAPRAGDRPVNDVRHVGDRESGRSAPVERTAAGRRAGFAAAQAGFRFFVVLARGFVEEFGDVFRFHGIAPFVGSSRLFGSRSIALDHLGQDQSRGPREVFGKSETMVRLIDQVDVHPRQPQDRLHALDVVVEAVREVDAGKDARGGTGRFCSESPPRWASWPRLSTCSRVTLRPPRETGCGLRPARSWPSPARAAATSPSFSAIR